MLLAEGRFEEGVRLHLRHERRRGPLAHSAGVDRWAGHPAEGGGFVYKRRRKLGEEGKLLKDADKGIRSSI